ncbi:PREDICTED: uncharacterized protein LOC105460524, partial [Wasmannia auropunctata]|uniref:uncharacterized protein LOC105460524 n=1 Tax=Wasmannia auropunctata TaxID=64793 RepID=UPI0005F02F97
MDFQSTNPFNVWLNLLSGNLLPMTSNSSFPIFWKMYSAFVWSVLIVCLVTLIPACFLVPIEKALSDGVIVLVVFIELVFTIVRINVQPTLVHQLIQKLNTILTNTENNNMKDIVIMNVNSVVTPFKFFLMLGTCSVIVWASVSFLILFERSTFYYADFRSPAIFSKEEPFSINVFLLGNVISMVSNIYLFLKKVSVDMYIAHLISLITSQYHYIASRLVLVFRNSNRQDSSSFSENNFTNSGVEKEIKSLCQQHNDVMDMMLMLKKLLSISIFLIYMNNVFRFCFLGIIFITVFTSATFVEMFMVLIYTCSALVQFYILCACFQNLSEA